MPSHEYICQDGHLFLLTQSIHEKVEQTVSCEICGKSAIYYWGNKKVAGRVSGGTGGGKKLGQNQKNKEKKG
jgi:hypothetical protein